MNTSSKLEEKYRRLNESYKALSAEIEYIKKLESTKDELILIAGHELKTPLTIIKGYLHLLENSSPECLIENTGKYLAKTIIQVGKIELLVTDLLDSSKIERGNLNLINEPFNFDILVENVIESIRQIHKSHDIKVLGKSNAVVLGDHIRLEQVIINYLTNAIKYSPDSAQIHVLVSHKKGSVEFSVKDFGIGIGKVDQIKLFSKFYRVENVAKRFHGLGMGLYISAEIIHHHKGKVGVISEEGKGSTFYFTLPVESLETANVKTMYS